MAGARPHPPAAAPRLVFRQLGVPLATDPLEVHVVTRDARGRALAFGRVHDKGGNHYDVFVVDLEAGSAEWLGLQRRFGTSYIQMTRAANGHVYLFSGEPGHFSKYDVDARQLVDLGIPGGAESGTNVSYTFGHHVGPDGRMYVAGYPGAHTVVCDPSDDSVRDLGCMTEDPTRQQYAQPPAVDGANRWLYTPLGLHHMELCAYDQVTRERRQILQEDLSAEPGTPTVFTGEDGVVYGEAGGRRFACARDGIREVEALPAAAGERVAQRADGYELGDIGVDGELEVREVTTGRRRMLRTPFNAVTYGVYSVGCERDAWVFGGGANSRAHVFACHQDTGELRDLGRQGGGWVQVYDLLNHARGIYLTSYPGGHIDRFVPETGERVAVAALSAEHRQERLRRLAVGPDGMVYTGGVPVKGHLTGALVRVDPADDAVKVWEGVLPNQSFTAVVGVPETGEVLLTTTIRGGTSAVPVEAEGWVALWSCAREEVVWKARPLPGTASYGYVARAANGVVYGLGDESRYFALDPVRREMVYEGRLPVSMVRPLGLAREERCGLLYGIGDDAVFVIDPADHTARVVARHESLSRGHGLYVTAEGVLYYGSGPYLWKAEVNG